MPYAAGRRADDGQADDCQQAEGDHRIAPPGPVRDHAAEGAVVAAVELVVRVVEQDGVDAVEAGEAGVGGGGAAGSGCAPPAICTCIVICPARVSRTWPNSVISPVGTA